MAKRLTQNMTSTPLRRPHRSQSRRVKIRVSSSQWKVALSHPLHHRCAYPDCFMLRKSRTPSSARSSVTPRIDETRSGLRAQYRIYCRNKQRHWSQIGALAHTDKSGEGKKNDPDQMHRDGCGHTVQSVVRRETLHAARWILNAVPNSSARTGVRPVIAPLFKRPSPTGARRRATGTGLKRSRTDA